MAGKNRILFGPFEQLLTMQNVPVKGALADEDLPVIQQGGLLVEDGIIKEIGDYNSMKNAHQNDGVIFETFSEGHVALPGFIDAHSHICYAGSRARDYAARNAGKSYLEIAKAGGGIWDTVQRTRNASLDWLMDHTLKRAEAHLQRGTTTLEVKSGYGLDMENELKMLHAITDADRNSMIDLIPTCLAAHTIPKDREIDSKSYLDELTKELLPAIRERKLADRVDIFVEEGAFGVAESIAFLEQAKDMGFECTVHADQFNTGGSQVAVAVAALSADHLEASTIKEIRLLADSDVMPVALPGASLGLGCGFTPARKLLDAGAGLAIASDHNPGSAPMGHLVTQAAILGTYEKLSQAEVLAAITVRAARALGLDDRGSLEAGKLGDLCIYQLSDINEILYHQGSVHPVAVVKKGRRIQYIPNR